MQEVSCSTADGGAKLCAMALTPFDRRTRFDVDLRPRHARRVLRRDRPRPAGPPRRAGGRGDRRPRRPAAGPRGRRPLLVLRRRRTAPSSCGTGIADGAVVVTLDDAAFSDWAQLQRSFNGMVVMMELTFRDGTDRDVSVWDALWHTLLEGWPVVDPDLAFVDRHGAPLDLAQSFGPDDDPADIAHFLREAGYLHLKGWLDPADMATIAEDIDRAVPAYEEGDGKSWWAVLADGTRRCVRLQEFLEHSPTTVAILEGDRWEQLRRTLSGDRRRARAQQEHRGADQAGGGRPGGIRRHLPPRLPPRPAPLRLLGHDHRDLGDRRQRGQRSPPGGGRLPPGGHARGDRPVRDPYLPIVAVTTEPGDLTVHLGVHPPRGGPAEGRRAQGHVRRLRPRPPRGRPARRQPGACGRSGRRSPTCSSPLGRPPPRMRGALATADDRPPTNDHRSVSCFRMQDVPFQDTKRGWLGR